MESLLVFIVIVALSALSSWLKRKQEEREQRGQPATLEQPEPRGQREESREAEDRPAGKKRSWDWEAELRRLLEGEEPSAPKQPEPPPPIPRTETAPPPPVVPPQPASPRPQPASRVVPVLRERVDAVKERLEGRLAHLQRTEAAAERAHELESNVAARRDQLREVRLPGPAMESPAQAARRRRGSPEAQRVKTALRRPRSAREVIIAAEIIGSPRGLQP